MFILPAMNTIWFWFKPESERRRLHGTPEDVMRKYEVLDSMNCCPDGLEIFIVPSKLNSSRPFNLSFFNKFSQLKFKSVHIGDSDPDFLDNEKTCQDLLNLARNIERFETDQVIIHAHHLQNNRIQRKKLLLSTLNQVNILIENNGFDSKWGGSVEAVEEILLDCPEFNFCLDIAHVKDFKHLTLDDFRKNKIITSRLSEIHFSFSTIQNGKDPYVEKGFHGYGPYHAMFSVLDITPSIRTKEFISNYPIVIEGIVPVEDRGLFFLKKEADILKK